MSVHMGLFPTTDWAWPILRHSIGSSQIETSNLWGCTDIYSRDSIQIHASNQKEPRSSPPVITPRTQPRFLIVFVFIEAYSPILLPRKLEMRMPP